MRTETEVYNEIIQPDDPGKLALKVKQAIAEIYRFNPERVDNIAAIIGLTIQAAYQMGRNHAMQETLQMMRPAVRR